MKSSSKPQLGLCPCSRWLLEDSIPQVAQFCVQQLPARHNLCPLGCSCFVQDKRAAKALRTEMKAADTNQDGMISFIEFLGYFQKMARYQADLARTQRLESYGRPRELPHCEFCPALPCPALRCPALPCPAPHLAI